MLAAQPAPTQSHILRGMMLRAFAVLSFSAMSAAMKIASEDGVTAPEMVFYRSIFGLPLVILWIALGPRIGIIRTKRPMAHLVRCSIGIIGITMNFAALIRLPLADATVIGFTAPIFATILSALILTEKIGPQRWAAVAVGFLGVLLVMRPGGNALDHLGLVFALAGAVGTAGVVVAVRQLGATEHPGTIVFWFFIASGVASGIGVLFVGHAHTPFTWCLLLFAGATGALAQVAMTHSLRDAPVSVLAPIDYGQIVWAALFGLLVWGSLPGWATLGGAALIIASGLVTAWREHQLRREQIPATPPLE